MLTDLIRRMTRRTGDAVATDGGIANTGVLGSHPMADRHDYDRDPARHLFAHGLRADDRTVTMSRAAANLAENVLIRLLANDDAMHALGLTYDEIRIAGLRQAISDAITVSDTDHRRTR